MITSLKEVFEPYKFNTHPDTPTRHTNDEVRDRYKSLDVLSEVSVHHDSLRGIHDPNFKRTDKSHPFHLWSGSGSKYLTAYNLAQSGIQTPWMKTINSPEKQSDWLYSARNHYKMPYYVMADYAADMDAALKRTKPTPTSGMFYSGISSDFSDKITKTYKIGQVSGLVTHIASSINPIIAGDKIDVAEISVPQGTTHVTYLAHQQSQPFIHEREAIIHKDTPLIYTGSSVRTDQNYVKGLIHHFQVTTTPLGNLWSKASHIFK